MEIKNRGTTSLASGKRVRKDSTRIEVIGVIDELDAVLGLARASIQNDRVCNSLLVLQKTLVLLMAELSYDEGTRQFITTQHLQDLENQIEAYQKSVPPFTEFVVPGVNQASASLHVARTIARRAERLLVRLSAEEKVRDELLLYVNRISEHCYLLARYEELQVG